MAEPFRIVPRPEWGAAQPSKGLKTLAYPVDEVYLHHEGGGVSPATLTVEQERAKMRELQKNAMNDGYSDFPYGVAVFGSGRAYEGRDLGFVAEGVTVEQAATMGQNDDSVSIVWPGNFNNQSPTPAQIASTVAVIHVAQLAGVVVVDGLSLLGHSDVYATACPGSSGYGSLPQLRSLVAHRGPVIDWNTLVKLDRWRKRCHAKPLKFWDHSDDVLTMQQLLRAKGLFRFKPNRRFGFRARASVNRLKRAHPEIVNADGSRNTDGRSFGGPAADALLR